MPLATQLPRPNTPSILGKSTPRKSNSSPRIVLNTAKITNKAKNHQAPSSRARISCDWKIAPKLEPEGSAKNGKTDTQAFSRGVFSTSSTTASATRNGTTHNQSLCLGSPVVGSRGMLSRSLRLIVAQRRSPSSRRTMIMDRTNNQTKPSVSSTTRVTPDPRGSEPESGASRGKAIQPRTPIGTVASAQIPRIFAREYCSSCHSLDASCTVGSLSTPPVAPCPFVFISFLLPTAIGFRSLRGSGHPVIRISCRQLLS